MLGTQNACHCTKFHLVSIADVDNLKYPGLSPNAT